MRVARIIVLAVLGLLAVNGATASASSPQWYECAKAPKIGGVYTGHYGPGCTGTGTKWEIKPGISKGKTYKGKGMPAVLHTEIAATDEIVECQKFKDEISPQPPNLVHTARFDFIALRSSGATLPISRLCPR